MKTIKSFFLITILVSILLSGCTASNQSSTSSSNIADIIKDILQPDSTAILAEKQVAEVQKELNKNQDYVFTADELNFLQQEGLVTGDNELKAWVK
jgi:hypothetical protein